MSDEGGGEVANVFEEAQALMDEMGDEEGVVAATDSLVIDGFSIDDMGLDDSGASREHNIIDARSSTNPAAGVEKVEEGQDPLSLVAAATTPTTPTTTSARRSSLTSLHDEQVKASQATHLNAPSLADVKARATGFATSMASFAKTAADKVQAAAAQVPDGIIPATATTQQQQPSYVSRQAAVELDNDQKTALIEQHLGPLLPGERVIMFLSNLLHVSDSAGWDYNMTPGAANGMWCCCMTFYRVVVFYTGTCPKKLPPNDWDVDCWPTQPEPKMLQMPLASMDRVEKSIYTTASNTTLMGLVMHGKDNGRQLRFTTPSYADTLRVHESIQTYAFPGRRNLGYLFAFESKRAQVMNSIVADAAGKKSITLAPVPKRCDAVAEFTRQFGAMNPCPWTLYTQMNATYQLCMSYPSVLAGPSSLPEASQETQRVLRQMAGFRSEQRITSLTWSSGVDGASLWRAAQPKVGLQGNRNAADEFYLRHIAESAASSNSLRLDSKTKPSKEWIQKLTGQGPDFGQLVEPGTTLKIMDLRPRASAMANRTQGYGYENTSHYVGTTIQFCNIANIHAVRDSYTKMSALCMSSTTSDAAWNSSVEDSKWLHHIRQIWNAAWEAAFWIHVHRMPVLLHCSHGWDRTSQVAVLTELLLDPYYRTRAGFACLIEKDFASFGHPFHTRCAHGEGRGGESATSGSSDEGQISPIFLQFIDCVYQLIKLYPEKFEFNEMYLLVLSEQTYSCRFGTLLCDTERERELVAGIRQRTHSIWDYLEARDDCCNSTCYKPSDKVLLMPLPTLLRNVSLWTNRHAMYGPKPTTVAPIIMPLDVVPAKDMTIVPGVEYNNNNNNNNNNTGTPAATTTADAATPEEEAAAAATPTAST